MIRRLGPSIGYNDGRTRRRFAGSLPVCRGTFQDMGLKKLLREKAAKPWRDKNNSGRQPGGYRNGKVERHQMHLYIGYYGVPGLLILILDLWAIISVLSSNLPSATKLLWVLLIVILPVIGLILWLLLGSRSTA